MSTSNEPMRHTIQNFMKREYERSGKLEWTITELLEGLNDLHNNANYLRKHIASGLQDAKARGIAEQTVSIPGAVGGAKYWALTRCLELATEPKKPVAETIEAALTEPDTEEKPVTNDRKPRHDDPAHITAQVEKHLGEFGEKLINELSRMHSDAEKLIKEKLAAISAPSATGEFDWEKLAALLKTDRQEMYDDAVERTNNQAIMSIADMGAKVESVITEHMQQNVDIAKGVAAAHEELAKLMLAILDKSDSEHTAKEDGYAKGFAAGWMAAEKRMKETLETAISSRLQAKGILVEKDTDGNVTMTDIPGQAKDSSGKRDHSLSETLRKIGAI